LVDSLESTLGGMCLALEKREQGTHGDPETIYSLVLSNMDKIEIIRLVLPQSFVDEIQRDTVGIEFSMSLDGTVSIDSLDMPAPAQLASIGLDALVVRDVSPDMLDDEPNAAEMLAKLRARLLTALRSVDNAMVSLRDRLQRGPPQVVLLIIAILPPSFLFMGFYHKSRFLRFRCKVSGRLRRTIG